MVYYFENKSSGSDNFIKIRQPLATEHSESDMVDLSQLDKDVWSSRFDIENYADFQVSIMSQQDYPNHLSQTIQDVHINRSASSTSNALIVSNWHEPSKLNNFRQYLKVTVTSEDEATIYIILTKPTMPEYRVNNYTFRNIDFYMDKIKGYRIHRYCLPATVVKKSIVTGDQGDESEDSLEYDEDDYEENEIKTTPVPFVWDDQTYDDKKLVLKINGKKQSYDISTIGKKASFSVDKKQYYIEVISTGYFREVEIRKTPKKDGEVSSRDKFASMIFASLERSNGLDLKAKFLGIGLSVVDFEPKELIYLSIFKISFSIFRETTLIDTGELEDQEELNLNIDNIQIDNMMSLDSPIVFTSEEGLSLNKETPFIQIKVSKSSNEQKQQSNVKIDAIQLKIQTMMLEVDTGIISAILTNVSQIKEIFDEESRKPELDAIRSGQPQSSTKKNSKAGSMASPPAESPRQNIMNKLDKEHV